ncbi:TonB-dependent receptor [Sphingomonas sp. MG17]|uniref:TonB-dependent receptor n=1 Tax=Sphingomonas tagetis TaxID=2949092 RepID=A0A9X2HJA2_9SPHN|nr:TonB-dependent receptor [Sphingomonas tagetis]MCP3731072.1 TonB-dependent receptor [Sphingomonas tagetis]
MRAILLASACVVALQTVPAFAQPQDEAGASRQTERSDSEIIVTATRREERIEDVPLSISAFSQEELTEKGIVGFEGIARETPGVVLNRPTQNFNNFTSRGIATNGYNANLQSSVAVYIDELPVSTIGNTTVVDPNLFDVERVEFLRGPQGTLFGSGSLSGAMRILTKSPDLNDFDVSALADLGLTGSDSFRQRYNLMVNVPVVTDKLAVRAVGFYRNEEGYLDNIGTGVHNSNTLVDWGGRVIVLWKPTDRLSIRLLGSYEDSNPKDSSLTSPALGREKRRSDRPDQFTGKQTVANATIEYEFDFAKFTSSTTYSDFDQKFYVDLGNTFGFLFPFALDADGFDKVFVEEARLVSSLEGPFQFTVGGFYLHRRRDVDFKYRSTPEFLQARNITGLTDEYYIKQNTYSIANELAAFGELTYRFSDRFWLTGGMRYGKLDAQGFTEAGGLGSGTNYYTVGFLGLRNVALTTVPFAAVTGVKARASKPSWKVSATFKPSGSLTTYATFSTGFRSPIVNAFAGRASLTNPADIIIPNGASSDDLKSYEIGAKARWLDGRVTMNVAAYYIDWSNIQAQANRVSDSVQFATNIGGATSKGFEVEMGVIPAKDVFIGLNAAYNDAKITRLSPTEAAISGAVLGHRLSAPRLQGAIYMTYGFDIGDSTRGTMAVNAQYVGSYNSSFPNTPGNPNLRLPTYGETDEYVNVNASLGLKHGSLSAQVYVENLFDDHSVVYVHPEAFLASRSGTLRPRTVGIRLGYGL